MQRTYWSRVVNRARSDLAQARQVHAGRLAVEWFAIVVALVVFTRFARPELVQDTGQWLAATFAGAIASVIVLFLVYVVLAPARIAEEDRAKAELLQAELDRKLKPFQMAAAVNKLRADLRQLGKDAYLPPSQMPHVVWDDRCAKLIAACEQLVEEQRNKYSIPLQDAITSRSTQDPRKIGKNPHTMTMLNRIDVVLGQVVSELEYV